MTFASSFGRVFSPTFQPKSQAAADLTIPLPDPAFSFVPFGISDDGDGTFSIDPTFNLLTHSNIPATKTYYVSTTGNNTNDGLTWETAFKTLAKAVSKADVDRIYMAAGKYVDGITNPTRDIAIIGVGDVVITWNIVGTIYVGAFSAVDNHYEATYTLGVGTKVVDFTQTDANGNYLEYTLKTSAAEVDAAASSYYYNTTTDVICIKTTDGRAPDANIIINLGSYFLNSTVENRTIYLENLKIVAGGINYRGSGSKLYIKDCLIDNVNVAVFGLEMLGLTDAIFQNTTITRSGEDGIRLWSGRMILVDCTIHHAGVGLAAGNASSCHSGYAIIVNGHYSYSLGRPIHDIGAGKGWYLGVHAHHAGTAGYPNFEAGTFGSDYFETWCDQCISSDSDLDFVASLPAAIHKHSCTGDASDSGDGVETYDY